MDEFIKNLIVRLDNDAQWRDTLIKELLEKFSDIDKTCRIIYEQLEGLRKDHGELKKRYNDLAAEYYMLYSKEGTNEGEKDPLSG